MSYIWSNIVNDNITSKNKYDLTHLTGPRNQFVMGPIQDDEALFLYSVVRGMRIERILEIGGLNGYSALNFLKAMGDNGKLYTVDINHINVINNNHIFIHKDAVNVDANDIDNIPIELIFFDCHVYESQMKLFNNLVECGMITNKTIIALHDTNVHPHKYIECAYNIEGVGWVHRPEERQMVNEFSNLGYHIFSLHPELAKHNETFPFRHGLTICQKFKKLEV